MNNGVLISALLHARSCRVCKRCVGGSKTQIVMVMELMTWHTCTCMCNLVHWDGILIRMVHRMVVAYVVYQNTEWITAKHNTEI